MSKLYFITGNKEKLEEAKAIIPHLEGLKVDLPEIQELNPEKIIRAKLAEARKKYRRTFFVEDTSLYIKCLNGMPGPLIKWFMDALGNKGIYDLVSKYSDNRAIAKTVVGYSNGKEIRIFEGEVKGIIVNPGKINAFGWDAIFQPEGSTVTFAEMSKNEKNKISMRRNALLKLQEYLGHHGHQ